MVGKTEQEQIEDIKHWWEKNGKYVLVVAILVFSSAVGGKVWRDYQSAAKERMSAEYEQIIQQIQLGNGDSALQQGSVFIEQNSDSSYASLAALALAKVEVEQGELDNARLRLVWVLEQSKDDAVKHVARLRLARVLMAQNKLDEALSHATHSDTGAFSYNYALVKGDLYALKGDQGLAKTAYQAALNSPDISPQLRSQVQMKLDDLGGVDS